MTAASAALHRQIGNVRKCPGRALAVDRAGKEPHADEEFLLGGEDAQAVENFLVGELSAKEGVKAV